jgi:hypothetical protein
MVETRQWVEDGKYYLEGEILPSRRPSHRLWFHEKTINGSYAILLSKVTETRLMGEIYDNVHTKHVDLSSVSHIIDDLKEYEDSIYVRARILDTPSGHVCKTLMDESINFEFHVRLRGFYYMREHPFEPDSYIVNENFRVNIIDIKLQ